MSVSKCGVALICSVFLVACSKPEVGVRAEVPKVKITELGVSDLKNRLYFPAVANAAERSHLSFRVAGEIIQIELKEGDFVKKGDVLAKLEPTDYQLDVDNAQARYSVIDSQYRRSSPLVKKGLLAKSQFDEIAAQRSMAFAELELAKLRLSFTELKAPVDGVISRVSAEQFENVIVGQQIVNIHSVEEVEVVLQLPDRFSVNQPTPEALAKIESIVRVPSGNEYIAKVKEYTTEPDPALGTFTVTLVLPMPETEYILDGMAVDVTSKARDVGLKINLGVTVPIEALFNADGDSLRENEKFVWVVDDTQTVSKRKVATGKVSQSTVQILKGLESEERVVTAGVARLREGMTVEVLSQEAKL